MVGHLFQKPVLFYPSRTGSHYGKGNKIRRTRMLEIERFVNLRCLLRCPSVGMVTKPSAEQTQDFSIHNEDFPALPGPNYKDTTLNNDESKTVSVSH